MLRLIFNLFEKRFIKYLNKKNAIKLTKDNLNLSFYDDEGRGYYKFSKDIELPMTRLAKLQEYLMWLSKGISKEEYVKALEFAKQGLEGGIKDGKGLAKIGFVLHELIDRSEMVIHDELFFNIIAVQLIRDDESPTEFNNEIQMQKVAAFKALNSKDDSFFLNIQEFLEQLNLSSTTKDQLEKLLKESQVLRGAMERMLSTE